MLIYFVLFYPPFMAWSVNFHKVLIIIFLTCELIQTVSNDDVLNMKDRLMLQYSVNITPALLVLYPCIFFGKFIISLSTLLKY